MNGPQTEQWLPVVGFEGWYEVSNLGRVKRVKTSTGKPSGRVLKSRPNAKGYRFVSLCVLGKVCGRMVHRLVAQAFIPNPDNLPEVNHNKALKHGGSNATSHQQDRICRGLESGGGYGDGFSI